MPYSMKEVHYEITNDNDGEHDGAHGEQVAVDERGGHADGEEDKIAVA